MVNNLCVELPSPLFLRDIYLNSVKLPPDGVNHKFIIALTLLELVLYVNPKTSAKIIIFEFDRIGVIVTDNPKSA